MELLTELMLVVGVRVPVGEEHVQVGVANAGNAKVVDALVPSQCHFCQGDEILTWTAKITKQKICLHLKKTSWPFSPKPKTNSNKIVIISLPNKVLLLSPSSGKTF